MDITRIIDGKRYSTASAEFLAAKQHRYPRDLFYEREELYRTKNGAFFIAGEGGPASNYRKWTGQNSCTGSERLTLVTEAEARQFLESTGEDGLPALERYFPVVEG